MDVAVVGLQIMRVKGVGCSFALDQVLNEFKVRVGGLGLEVGQAAVELLGGDEGLV